MFQYKQALDRCGINTQGLTKKESRSIFKDRMALCELLSVTISADKDEIFFTKLKTDDLRRFVNYKNRLPTEEEINQISEHPNFKFWFNKQEYGDEYNNVWTYPSKIHELYNSL